MFESRRGRFLLVGLCPTSPPGDFSPGSPARHAALTLAIRGIAVARSGLTGLTPALARRERRRPRRRGAIGLHANVASPWSHAGAFRLAEREGFEPRAACPPPRRVDPTCVGSPARRPTLRGRPGLPELPPSSPNGKPRRCGRGIPFGGEGGIRTPVTISGKPVFETGAFDHSATSPGAGAGL